MIPEHKKPSKGGGKGAGFMLITAIQSQIAFWPIAESEGMHQGGANECFSGFRDWPTLARHIFIDNITSIAE